MECQIVPSYKHVCTNAKIIKPRKGDQQVKKNSQICNSEEENKVYILQPMFKPPKSTKELVSSPRDDITLAVKAISESNKETDRNGQFNHFTMSRKGVVKLHAVSRVEDPMHSSSPYSTTESRCESNDIDNTVGSGDKYAASRRGSCLHLQSKQHPRERLRRASAGDVLVKNNTAQNRNSARYQQTFNSNNGASDCNRIVSIGPDEVLLIPQQRCPAELDNSKRRGSCGKVLAQENGQQLDNLIPRRKSFHDWYSIQEWYSPEPTPESFETNANTRRNVISPNTLSRLLPNVDDQGSRNGSGTVSVCTEADRMSYNFNLPSRRLVSHKELKRCSLPYNDNIGLEEAVSSDQARKLVKSKQSIAIKKKYETDKQTPKQVWYRTVRSILAANHLYHSVKRKQ